MGIGVLQNVTVVEANETHVWNETTVLNFVCMPKDWWSEQEEEETEMSDQCEEYTCALPGSDDTVVIAVVTATSLLTLIPLAALAYLIVAAVLIWRRCRRQAIPF